MIIDLERKHYLLFFSSIALIVIGSVLFYYVSYAPKETKVNQLQQEIQIEEQHIQVIEKQQADGSVNLGNTSELQRKIPVAPNVEQLILELEKAEVLSDSRILNMIFGKEVNTASTSTLEENVNSNNTDTAPANSYFPEGLKKVTVSMTVESAEYEDLTKFLETIESLTRVTQIETVALKGQPEITSVEQDTSSLTYSVKVSAFYHPELEDIIEDLPPLSVPEPSNKTNPFIDNE